MYLMNHWLFYDVCHTTPTIIYNQKNKWHKTGMFFTSNEQSLTQSTQGSIGKLILKCPFGVFKSPKKTTKFSQDCQALASKKRSNQKNKGTLYC